MTTERILLAVILACLLWGSHQTELRLRRIEQAVGAAEAVQ